MSSRPDGVFHSQVHLEGDAWKWGRCSIDALDYGGLSREFCDCDTLDTAEERTVCGIRSWPSHSYSSSQIFDAKEKWPEVEASGHGKAKLGDLANVELDDLNRVGRQVVREVARYVA